MNHQEQDAQQNAVQHSAPTTTAIEDTPNVANAALDTAAADPVATDDPDTQERSDALASINASETSDASDTSNESDTSDESNSSDESALSEPQTDMSNSDDDAPSAVENINTDPNLTPEDAGEISGAPGESIPAPARPNSRYTRGQLVEASISATTPTSVTVDLGDGMQGIIPGRELERMSRKMIEDLVVGSQITVYVVNPNDHQGNVVLSVNRAAEELDWQQAEDYRASQQAYEGMVAGYNKGGLIVRFGRLRGFVPQSQISDDRRRVMDGQTPEDRYGSMVNDSIVVKVMEVDRSRNRLILSERAAMREMREKRKEDLIHRLEVGQVMEGRVVSLEDFGAFVDIGGAEGLVHLTELSWKHVTHPRELLKVGQLVKAEVISVDPDRKRIGLSMKRQEADPWDEVATTYGIGQLVQATITKLTKFGAFARLVDAPDIEGLVHISELSDQRVNHPREVVKESEKLTLRVVKVDVKNRRLGLSLKRVNSAEYLDMDMRFATMESGDYSAMDIQMPNLVDTSDMQDDSDNDNTTDINSDITSDSDEG